MKVGVGVKECPKKKLVRSTRAGHVDKLGDEKLKKEQMSRKWTGNRGEEDRNCILCALSTIGLPYASH